MRIIVTGGRINASREVADGVFKGLSLRWPADTIIVHGNAAGYDTMAGDWALREGYKVEAVRIDSHLDGHKGDAPKNRNIRMLARGADAVVAFPGGPGTRHMAEIADRAGIQIYDVEVTDDQFTVWIWNKTEPATLYFKGKLNAKI